VCGRCSDMCVGIAVKVRVHCSVVYVHCSDMCVFLNGCDMCVCIVVLFVCLICSDVCVCILVICVWSFY
jgi:hypothetical protein